MSIMNSIGNTLTKAINTSREKKKRKSKFLFDEIGIIAVVLLIGLILSLNSPYFLTLNNLLRVGRQMAFVGLLSVGMSFIIATGQIDISVGRIIT